jgi:hypothetical protein
MNETNLDNICKRCEFIDLLDYLEKINIDYVDINNFEGFIYMDPRNEYNYKIAKVINYNELYSFYYEISSDNKLELIPNAEFHPEVLYDFSIDLYNKKFKKFDEYKKINHTIINIESNILSKSNNKSFIRKIFGC